MLKPCIIAGVDATSKLNQVPGWTMAGNCKMVFRLPNSVPAFSSGLPAWYTYETVTI